MAMSGIDWSEVFLYYTFARDWEVILDAANPGSTLNYEHFQKGPSTVHQTAQRKFLNPPDILLANVFLLTKSYKVIIEYLHILLSKRDFSGAFSFKKI